jgi:hypothetical protein
MRLLTATTLPALPFVVCDENGRILRTGVAPGQMVEIQAQSGEHVFAGVADQIRQYIDIAEAAVLDRPTLTPIVDGLTISNLPNGCIASTEGQEFLVISGQINLEYELPGTYAVTLRAWPWLDATVEVVQP